MKSIKILLFSAIALLVAGSCKKELDPIKTVSPGPDLLAPSVVISYPVQGKIVRSSDSIATVTLKMTAEDDIELKSVKLLLDGNSIGTISTFKDYRRAIIEFPYKYMNDGEHQLTVNVEDLTGKTGTQTVKFKKVTAPPYEPLPNEMIYFSMDGTYLNLINGVEATIKGSPGFTSGKLGDAYAGAKDAYLTYPSAEIQGNEFSFAMWYKVNGDPKRAGIISISPAVEDRNNGLRFAREESGGKQNLFLNLGIGTTEVWINPFYQAELNADWLHIAMSISETHIKIYVNGAVVKEQDLDAKISWKDCPSISIGSGAPNFVYWEHFSDLSLYDEMHFFTRAITEEEVLKLYDVKK